MFQINFICSKKEVDLIKNMMNFIDVGMFSLNLNY